MSIKLDLEPIVEEKKKNLADILTRVTIDTEGLIEGQTPLRIVGKPFKETIQGVKIDWEAHKKAPANRKNFYFVKPSEVPVVIKRQYQKYFNNPAGYGMSDNSTLKQVIEKFDQENPINKIKQLESQGIDVNEKVKDVRNKYDLSRLNPFAVTEAYADEVTPQYKGLDLTPVEAPVQKPVEYKGLDLTPVNAQKSTDSLRDLLSQDALIQREDNLVLRQNEKQQEIVPAALFGAGKIFLSRTELYKDPEIKRLMQEHPIATSVGETARDLTLLLPIGKALRIVTKAPFIAPMALAVSNLAKGTATGRRFLNIFEAERYIAKAIHSGATFGTLAAIKEAGIERPDQTIINTAQNIAGNALWGAGLGISTAAPNYIARIATAGTYGGITTALSGGDKLDIVLNTVLFGAFELLGGKEVDRNIKLQAIQNMRKATAEYLSKGGMSVDEAVKVSNTAINNSITKAGGLDSVLDNNSAPFMNYVASEMKKVKPTWELSKPKKLPDMSPFGEVKSTEPEIKQPVTEQPVTIPEVIKPETKITPIQAAQKIGKVIGIDSETKLPIIDTTQKGIQRGEEKASEAKQEGLLKQQEETVIPNADVQDEGKLEITNKPIEIESALLEEAKKYKTAEEFVTAQRQVFHQTTDKAAKSIETEGFRLGERQAGKTDVLPNGINTKGSNAELRNIPGKIQVEVFTNAKNVKEFDTNQHLVQYVAEKNPEYSKLVSKATEYERKVRYEKQLAEIEKTWTRANNEESVAASNKIIEAWGEEQTNGAIKARAIATDILKKEGYDGVYIKQDIATPSFGKSEITDNLIVFDQSQIKTKSQLTALWHKAQEGELFEKKPRVKQPSSSKESAGTLTTTELESAEPVQTLNGEPFKLSDEITNLVKKYAIRFGENYTGKFEGLFFQKTDNIFLKSKNDLATATHEITHYLDKKYAIGDKVTAIKGFAKNGNPIYESYTKNTRKALTEIYVKYYLGGQKDHKLAKRVQEGIAVFFERYILFPELTSKEFPQLINDFINPSGNYYSPIMKDFINDSRAIIGKYQKLDPLNKIGTRVHNSEVLFTKPYLNAQERAIHWNIDHIYPLEKLAKESGEHFTNKDPSLIARIYNYIPHIIQHNLSTTSPIVNLQKSIFLGKAGLEFKHESYFTFDENLSLIKKFDFNWATLVKNVDNLDDFNNWLVARRTKFSYDKLDILKENALNARKQLEENSKIKNKISDESESGEVLGGLSKTEIDSLKNIIKEYINLRNILTKDKIERTISQQAYEQHLERFKKNANMFDKLVRADLELLNNPKVGLVSNKMFEELSKEEGYATFKRNIFNEVIGNPEEESVRPTNIRIGGKKVSSLIGRHGSAKDIISPIFASMVNHQEIFKKATKQMVWNGVVDISEKSPDLFQKIPVIRVPMPDGKFMYPQDKDPNIIMGFRDGKRIAIVANKELKNLIEGILTPANIGLAEKTFVWMARAFTKGTTGLYPQFAITNLMIDQITAASNTWTKFKPIYTPISEFMKVLTNHESPEGKFAFEYFMLGGEQQAFLSFSDMTPKEAYDFMTQEKNTFKKIIELVDEGLDILSLPVKTSEILNRMAEYIRARKNGFTQLAALELAGRVTVPFHHRGARTDWTRFMVRSIPYFNASLEALAQFARSAKSPRTRKQLLFVVGLVNMTAIAALMTILKSGTEKQKKLYESINPDELGRYIFFPHTDGENLLKFRIPQEMSVPANIMNMIILENIRNPNYKFTEYLRGATSWIPDQLNPTNPVRAMVSWIPQAISPALSVGLNIKFYPSARPLEPDYMKYIPKSERVFDNTSNLARFMGPKLNLSPIQFEALLEGYVGRTTRLVTGKEQSNPFIRKLYFTASRQVVNFYEEREKNKEEISQIENNPDSFTKKQIEDIQYKEEYFKNITKLLKEYRQEIKKNKNSDEAIKLRDEILDEIDILK